MTDRLPEQLELTADEMEQAKSLAKVIRSPMMNRLIESHESIRETRDKYATAARSIWLNLDEFCDESLPVDEMIMEAARRARELIIASRMSIKDAKEMIEGREKIISSAHREIDELKEHLHRAELKMEAIRQIAVSGSENQVADEELLRGYLLLILKEFGVRVI